MLIGPFMSKWYKIFNADLLPVKVIPFATDYVSDISPIAA